MNVKSLEPLLRDATIRAIDSVGRKVAGADVAAENAFTRLLDRWNALGRDERENVASVVIATAITAVSAITALQRGKKTVAKKVAKRVLKKTTR